MRLRDFCDLLRASFRDDLSAGLASVAGPLTGGLLIEGDLFGLDWKPVKRWGEDLDPIVSGQ